MNGLLAITVLGLAAFCQGFLLTPDKHECTTNSDCQASQCCVSDYHGHYCAYYQNNTDPCHRPGHSLSVFKCGCGPNLMCEHIHLDPGHVHPSGDPVSSVEGSIEAAGLGFCSPTSP